MKFIQYFSRSAIVFLIGFIVIFGIIERKNIFEIFTQGVKEGLILVINLFPTWLGLFVAVGMLKASGVIDFLVEKLYIILKNISVEEKCL